MIEWLQNCRVDELQEKLWQRKFEWVSLPCYTAKKATEFEQAVIKVCGHMTFAEVIEVTSPSCAALIPTACSDEGSGD